MDDADRAAELEEHAWQDLERRLASARNGKAKQSLLRSRCRGCGLVLTTLSRQQRGICLECAEREEQEAKRHGLRDGVGGL